MDWEPAITAILNDIKRGEAIGVVAAKFHNGLVQSIVEVVTRIGEPKVVLTGGCFQNKYLLEQTVRHLQANGVQVYWHHKVPPNDGGIALGQIMAAMRTSRTTSPHSSDVQITTGTGFSAEIQSLATSATADS